MKKIFIINIMILMTLVLVGCETKDEFANTDPIDATMVYCKYVDNDETETKYTLDTKDGMVRVLTREEKVTKKEKFNRTVEIAMNMREEIDGIPGLNMNYDETEKSINIRFDIDYSLLDIDLVNSKVSDYYKEDIFTTKALKLDDLISSLRRIGYTCNTK